MEQNHHIGDSRIGRAFGIVYRRVTVIVFFGGVAGPCAARRGATEVSSSRRSS